jgi:hypothetical protein
MIGLRATRTMFLAATLLCAPAHAAEQSAVREMMVEAAIVAQFEDFGERFRSQLLRTAPAQSDIPGEFVGEFAEIGGRVMNGERFLDDLEVALAELLTAEEVSAISEFYHTPLGRKVGQAETAGARVEAEAEMEAQRTEILARLKENPERLALARRADEVLLMSELTATMTTSMMRALVVGGLQSGPRGADADTVAMVEQQVAALHAPLVERFREDVLLFFGWIYRDLSGEELAAYVDFLESEVARSVYAGFFVAVSDLMNVRAGRIGEEFAAVMEQKRT